MKLKFNNNGKFKILLFGDIHEHTDYKTNPKFKDMNKLMNAALDEYKPDLCVLLGDNCNTDIYKESPEKFKKMLCAVIEPITSRKIPVAAILGNHEHDNGFEDEIVAVYNSIDGCIMRNDAPPEITGNANFKEFVYSSDGKNPVFCLWFIDSNNCHENRDISHYDYVHPDQIEWFEKECEKNKELNGGKPMPSFVFQHTPVPEEYELLRKARFWELPVAVRGYNTKKGTFYVGKKGTEGYVGEGPCSPDVNSGQFASWKKVGGILGAFFGHDHLNDFWGYHDGIFMAQHKTAGFRAYTDGCRSCVRLVTIDEKKPGKFEHELKRFKQFGLKSESLGPILRTISDRQSFWLHVLGYAAAAVGGVAIIGLIIKILIEVFGG
ncbi:MAG: metallophosphoesterase [Clostridia bacterium]|nr:metallophosphoesterase [Clostridia bacterium]